MAMTSDLKAAAAYNRFGLGFNGAPSRDPYARLMQEIGGAAAQPKGLSTSKQLLTEVRAWQIERRRVHDKGGMIPPSPADATLLREIDARFNGIYMTPDIGLSERLVMFWTNHFAVSREKDGHVGATAGAFEREAIRPYIYGRFADMLLAVESHPAMLYFLDNVRSTGPDSPTGRKRKDGLNENLAREILELHTLGVRTGYNQADVTAFARAITGWTVTEGADMDDGNIGEFRFRAATHQPGPQTVMGRTYADDGVAQGRRILADLAVHPATARHIATKLARHFISDAPPPGLVDRMAAAFLDTGGDLKTVTRVLVQSDEAIRTPLQKLRLPQEFLAASLRATGAALKPSQINSLLQRMGQPIWQPGGPNGFSDLSTVWATPVSLEARISAATTLARRTSPDRQDPRSFADAVLGRSQSDATRGIIAHADSRPQGLAIALLSPEFMRR